VSPQIPTDLLHRRSELDAYASRVIACHPLSLVQMAVLQVLAEEVGALDGEMGVPRPARERYQRCLDNLIREYAGGDLDDIRDFQRHLRRLRAEDLTWDDVIRTVERDGRDV